MTLEMERLWQVCEEREILMRLMSLTGGSGGVSKQSASHTPNLWYGDFSSILCLCSVYDEKIRTDVLI